MYLPDVNVLICAHRIEATEHQRFKDWLASLASSPAAFALSDLVSVGFVRIVTNPRIWSAPTPPEVALEFIARLRGRGNCRPVQPGPDGWKIFSDLVTFTKARGKLVADAHHAAIAIEHGCEFVTTDADFARFPGLRFRHPLAAT